MSNRIGVVITTGEHRGVFFGYVETLPGLNSSKTVTAQNVRMCVYWPQDQHGIPGLAVNGPVDGCKISPAAPKMILTDVNAIMVCTDAAVAEWETGKWS